MDQLKQELKDTQLEKSLLLAERWKTLPSSIKTMNQLAGKTAVACGATHHVMERCNFSCTCCYLGAEANKTEPLPFEEAREQLDLLRANLGVRGKVQITAGEVTLLPVEDLGRIIKYALSIGLDPMVMSHGQRFLDEPDYLFSLVEKYELGKVSIHVDTTQRGRKSTNSRMTEADLNAVRNDFADLIREVRRKTGRPFKAASTITVTQDNLGQMNEVLSWFLKHADAFRLLSFQPVADVGRTRKSRSKDPVHGASLWEQVNQACGREMNSAPMHFGHPLCNTTVPIIVVNIGSRKVIFEGLRKGNENDLIMFSRAVDQIGSKVRWSESLFKNSLRVAKIFVRNPRFFLQTIAYAFFRSFDEFGRILELFKGVILERKLPRVSPFLIVVHNFMSPEQLKTEEGEERLNACVFKLAVGDKMVSMCEMNATDLRAKIDRMQIRSKAFAEAQVTVED